MNTSEGGFCPGSEDNPGKGEKPVISPEQQPAQEYRDFMSPGVSIRLSAGGVGEFGEQGLNDLRDLALGEFAPGCGEAILGADGEFTFGDHGYGVVGCE